MKTTRQIVVTLLRRYPYLIASTAVLLFVAGLLKGVSVTMLLPLLSVLSNKTRQVGDDVPLLQRITDQALDFLGISPTFTILLVLTVSVVVVATAVDFFSKTYIGFGAVRVGADFRRRLLEAVLKARWRHSSQISPGGLTAALGTEAESTLGSYVAIGKMLGAIFQIAVQLSLAALISLSITAGGIVFGAIMAALFSGLMQQTRVAAHQRKNSMEALSARSVETMTALKSLKAMGDEDQVAPALHERIDSVLSARRKITVLSNLVSSGPEALAMIVLAFGLYIYVEVVGGTLEPILVMAILFMRSATAIRSLQTAYQTLVRSEASFLFLENMIGEAVDEREPSGGEKPPTGSTGISLKNVGLTYLGQERSVLHDITLDLPAVGFVAIVGPTGVGKSSMINLIAGLESPSIGEIYIGDRNLSEIDSLAWRHQIGYVPQEISLFPSSILSNVTLDDPKLSAKQATQALEAAGAWPFVSQLPSGIDTLVGQSGSKLSGGQRQRIAIARALIRKPKLLILDEATTALDSTTETEILTTLKQLSKNFLVLAISHGSAVRSYADQTIVMHDGGARFMDEPVQGQAAKV